MSISYLLVLLGLVLLGAAVWALFWAVDDGQFDDLEKHGAAPLEEGEVNSSAEPSPAPRRET
jgi:cbb3-type cytochrome oxidase maturation protein